jgi:hypothetical protein
VNPLQVRAVARIAPAVLVALALIGCGGDGDDRDDARQSIRDFVTATNERDGDRLCGELLSAEYMEKATGASGEEAEEACKQQLDLVTGLRLKLVSLGDTSIDGEEATVRAVIATDGRRTPQVFSLAKEDGRWKLVGGSGEP